MYKKPDHLKIQFFSYLKKGKTIKEASAKVGISNKTGVVWAKTYKVVHANILEACEILSFRIKDEVEKQKLSAYEISQLSEALKNLENGLFMYTPLVIEAKPVSIKRTVYGLLKEGKTVKEIVEYTGMPEKVVDIWRIQFTYPKA